jgi:hypothetical protein
VYPHATYNDAQDQIYIYGHGFAANTTVSVTWIDPAGNAGSAGLVDVEVIDEYTLRGRLPDLSTEALPYLIYPYHEFVTDASDVSAGLYDCTTHQPVLWERGKTDGYCDELGTPLAYAAPGRDIPLIPPGASDSVLHYASWYDSLAACAAGGNATAYSDEQLALLIPDYGLGCFYPDSPNSGQDGAQNGVPLTYAYCPAQVPAAEVNIKVNLPDGRSSEIERGLSLLDFSHDYYNNEDFGGRVRGSFGAPLDVALGADPGPQTLADLNQDGIPDLVVVNRLSDSVSILWGPSYAPEEEEAQSRSVGAGPAAVAVGDIDGDGLPDIVTANTDGSSLTVLYGDDVGDFASSKTLELEDPPSALALADFDEDGRIDLVVGSEAGANLRVMLQQPDGSFTDIASSPYKNIAPVDVAVGDVDGKDGMDVVATSSSGDPIVVLVQLPGDGATFSRVSAASPLQGGRLATALVIDASGAWVPRIVDLNGDGLADIATIHADSNPALDSILLFRGKKGDNELYYPSYEIKLELAAAPQGITVGDANGDGFEDSGGLHNLDLIAVTDDGSAAVFVNASREPEDGQDPEPLSFVALRTVSAGPAPVSVLSQDLDGDGDYDLAVVSSAPDSDVSQISLLSNPSTIAEYLSVTLNYCE